MEGELEAPLRSHRDKKSAGADNKRAQVPEVEGIDAEPRLLLMLDVQTGADPVRQTNRDDPHFVSRFVHDIEKLQQERPERAKQEQESHEKQFEKMTERTAQTQKRSRLFSEASR